MKVSDLIKQLQNLPQKAEVIVELGEAGSARVTHASEFCGLVLIWNDSED